MTNYYVTSEELLGDNYLNIGIDCSTYNPNIDGTVTVTVTVKDVYGDAVSGEEVTVTASEGNFTAYNGSSITGASSHTGTTNSSGQFTLTYTCSAWGLITFSTNTASSQIRVTGFKKVLNNTTYQLWVDESQRLAQVRASRSNITINTGDGYNSNDFKIPSEYRPSNNLFVPIGRNAPQILNYIWTDGTVGIYNNTGNQWTNFNFSFINEYHF